MVAIGKDFYVNNWKEAGDEHFKVTRLSTHSWIEIATGDGEFVTIPDGAIVVVVAVDREAYDLIVAGLDLALGSVVFLGGLFTGGAEDRATRNIPAQWLDEPSLGEIPF